MPTSTIVYTGDLRTLCTHLKSETKIETDAPTDNNGKGERFSPTDLVATALGSCAITIMGIRARDLGVDLKGFHIEITKTMASNPRRIAQVDVIMSAPEGFETSEKNIKILEKAALTCPVSQSLSSELKQNFVFNW